MTDIFTREVKRWNGSSVPGCLVDKATRCYLFCHTVSLVGIWSWENFGVGLVYTFNDVLTG